jgi:hypothetical protein
VHCEGTSGPARIAPPAELAGKAPRDWPGGRPAIGVLDLGEGLGTSWTRITADQWVAAFSGSRLHTVEGLEVRRIGSLEELKGALSAGPTAWLAIVNPYGESFPAAGPGTWRETIAAIRSYVEHGGSWWEVAGYSLYSAAWREGGAWRAEAIAGAGTAALGVPVGGGEVEQPAEALMVTAAGRRWLGEELAARVASLSSVVNRGLLRGSEDPGHVALVAGRTQDFIGGYRLNGWGWLWRIGGFWPNPEVALPVAVAATEYAYDNPPGPPPASSVSVVHEFTVP